MPPMGRARHDNLGPSSSLLRLFTCLLFWLRTAVAASSSPASTTLHIAVLPSAAPPAPYLDILYTPDPESSSSSAKIITVHDLPATLLPSPSSPEYASTLIGLGFARPDLLSTSKDPQKAWSSIAVPPSVFDISRDRTLSLLVDRHGVAYHLSFGSQEVNTTTATATGSPTGAKAKTGAKSKTKKQSQQILKEDRPDGTVNVVIKHLTPGPSPVLNRPVVLNDQGQIAGQEQEGDNRSFLQKYWWAIAAFLLLQVLVGGGGDK